MPTPPPIAVDLPFRVGDDGGIQATRDIDRQIKHRLISIVGTEPRERVMLPEFGVPAADFLYEPDPVYVENELTFLVGQQTDRWEPGLIVKTVVPLHNDDGSTAVIDVKYARTDSPNSNPDEARRIHTAIISATGVREVLRG